MTSLRRFPSFEINQRFEILFIDQSEEETRRNTPEDGVDQQKKRNDIDIG